MIVLDTTVLVYAVGGDHPLRTPCREITEAIGSGRLRATTTVEVIQEFAHVWARRRSRAEATALAVEYVDLLAPLARPDDADLHRGLDLFARFPSLGAFDSVLASIVLGAEHLSAIVSADSGFSSVDSLLHVAPSEPDLVNRLARRDVIERVRSRTPLDTDDPRFESSAEAVRAERDAR